MFLDVFKGADKEIDEIFFPRVYLTPVRVTRSAVNQKIKKLILQFLILPDIKIERYKVAHHQHPSKLLTNVLFFSPTKGSAHLNNVFVSIMDDNRLDARHLFTHSLKVFLEQITNEKTLKGADEERAKEWPAKERAAHALEQMHDLSHDALNKRALKHISPNDDPYQVQRRVIWEMYVPKMYTSCFPRLAFLDPAHAVVVLQCVPHEFGKSITGDVSVATAGSSETAASSVTGWHWLWNTAVGVFSNTAKKTDSLVLGSTHIQENQRNNLYTAFNVWIDKGIANGFSGNALDLIELALQHVDPDFKIVVKDKGIAIHRRNLHQIAGLTALQKVAGAKGDDVRPVLMLLKAGADLRLTDAQGDDALQIATKAGNVEIVKAITEFFESQDKEKVARIDVLRPPSGPAVPVVNVVVPLAHVLKPSAGRGGGGHKRAPSAAGRVGFKPMVPASIAGAAVATVAEVPATAAGI